MCLMDADGMCLAIHHYQEASDFGSLKARAALRRLSRFINT